MDLPDGKIWFLLAVMVYGGSTVYSVSLWKKGFRRNGWWNFGLLATGLVLHTLAMVQRGITLARCPVGNLYEALVFVSWALVAACLLLSATPRYRQVTSFAAPLLFMAGLFALLPALDKPSEFPGHLHWASLHAALILLAYGAFGIAAVAGMMYLTQEHDLKFDKIRALTSKLPSIQRLETVADRLLWVGWVLLTAGLLLSPLLLHQEYGVYFKSDPKLIWSLLVWGLYAALLMLHWRSAAGGRRLSWGAVGGFAFILLTFWGFNLLSGIHNP